MEDPDAEGLTPEAAKKPKKKRPASTLLLRHQRYCVILICYPQLRRYRLQAATSQSLATYLDTKDSTTDTLDRWTNFCAYRRCAYMGKQSGEFCLFAVGRGGFDVQL